MRVKLNKALVSCFRFAFVGVMCLVISLFCGGSLAQGADDKIVKVGHIHPLTGSLAYSGKVIRAGLLVAVEEVNAAGGIKSLGGMKLQLIDGDSEGKPEIGMAEAERLITREKVVALLGSFQSSVTFTTTQLAEKYGLPHVIPMGVADDILQRGFKYSFRVNASAGMAGKLTNEHLTYMSKLSGTPIRRLGLINENSLAGKAIIDGVANTAKDFGFEVVERVTYPATSSSLTIELSKLKAANPDVIVSFGYFPDGVLLAKTTKEIGLKVKAIVGCLNGAFSDPKFVDEAGRDAEGFMNTGAVAYMGNPKTKLVAEQLETKYGVKISGESAYAYTAMRILADALERAGSTKPDAIQKALVATEFKDHVLPQGPVVFDKVGQNVNAMLPLSQVQNGKVVMVAPEKYAETKPVFPVK